MSFPKDVLFLERSDDVLLFSDVFSERSFRVKKKARESNEIERYANDILGTIEAKSKRNRSDVEVEPK